MDYAQLEAYLLAKTQAKLEYPFAPDVPVFKVRGKMFALVGGRGGEMFINLKCQPEQVDALTDIFPAIRRAYHMNKRHWLSLYFDGSDAEQQVFGLIDNSYSLVVATMSKSVRALLLD